MKLKKDTCCYFQTRERSLVHCWTMTQCWKWSVCNVMFFKWSKRSEGWTVLIPEECTNKLETQNDCPQRWWFFLHTTGPSKFHLGGQSVTRTVSCYLYILSVWTLFLLPYFPLLALLLASVPPSSPLSEPSGGWGGDRGRPAVECSKGHETIHLESPAPSHHRHHLSIPKCVTGVTLEPDTLWTRHRRFRHTHTLTHTHTQSSWCVLVQP